jgi:hypothetical protein
MGKETERITEREMIKCSSLMVIRHSGLYGLTFIVDRKFPRITMSLNDTGSDAMKRRTINFLDNYA